MQGRVDDVFMRSPVWLLPSLVPSALVPLAEASSGTYAPAVAFDVASAVLHRDGQPGLMYLLGGTAPALRIFIGDAKGFSSDRSEETLHISADSASPA
jgi:hypothetical protein